MEAEPDRPLAFMIDRPELEPHLALYSEAFSDLSTDRQLGAFGGAGPIPWTAIDRYAYRHEIDDTDGFDRLRRMIRAQDRTYLDHMAEEAKKKSGK